MSSPRTKSRNLLAALLNILKPPPPAESSATATPDKAKETTRATSANSTMTAPVMSSTTTSAVKPEASLSFNNPNIGVVGAYRPSHLPPKSEREARKHMREVRRIQALYRKKLEREQKENERRRKKEHQRKLLQSKIAEQKRKEDAERENRLQHHVTLWEREILPNWNKKDGFLISKPAKTKAREMAIKHGVPTLLRKKVWPLWCANSLGVTREIWERNGKRAAEAQVAREQRLAQEEVDLKGAIGPDGEEVCTKTDSQIQDEKVDRPRSTSVGETVDTGEAIEGKEMTYMLIETDISRTFPIYCFFQEECPMHQELLMILQTYCFYQPKLGYVQGMSYLAGHLLFYMDVYQTFEMFCNLLESPFLRAFIMLDATSPELLDRYELYHILLRDNYPRLYRHLRAEDIAPDMYFLEWSLTLFCKRLSLEAVGRVWDQFFVLGEVVIYKTAVAIMGILKPKLLGESMARILKCLATLPQKIQITELFQTTQKVRLSSAFKRKLEEVKARNAKSSQHEVKHVKDSNT